MISILEETGNLDGDEVNVVNLFDNPFLAYTAKEVWDIVDPVIKEAKVFMKHSQIDRLRDDVDYLIDLKMTVKDARLSVEKRNQKIKRELCILTVEDIERLQQQLDETQKRLQTSESKVEELENDNKKKEKEIVRLRSTKAKTNTKSQKKNKGKNKRRKRS